VKIRQPLKRRIVIAFVLMTLSISGAFSIGIVAIVHLVENHLVSDEMRLDLLTAIDDLGTGQAVVLNKGSRIFTDAAPELAPPPEFAEVKAGFSEVFQGEEAYYAFRLNRDGFSYLLIQDQLDFEARERGLFKAVLACFCASLLIAWGLGSLLANRVLQPVVQLADEVRSRTRDQGPDRLAINYADDEVGRLAQTFDSTLEKLNQSLDREKLFTGDVSHELRTPLMVIHSSCELLEQTQALAPKQRALLDRIHRASDEMLELVGTLLMLAREREAVVGRGLSLGEAARQQSEIWQDQFTARGIDYRCVVEAEDERQYQPTFLRTVMSNLLRNSLYYTEEGRVRLVVFDGGFRVEDTGPGIAPEQQARMFQPFERGAQARGEGLGLGLSLVKRICEHQGWSVTILPAQPRGCVFRIDLRPADAPTPATGSAGAP
jgi:signal transduction histidine kinase